MEGRITDKQKFFFITNFDEAKFDTFFSEIAKGKVAQEEIKQKFLDKIKSFRAETTNCIEMLLQKELFKLLKIMNDSIEDDKRIFLKILAEAIEEDRNQHPFEDKENKYSLTKFINIETQENGNTDDEINHSEVNEVSAVSAVSEPVTNGNDQPLAREKGISQLINFLKLEKSEELERYLYFSPFFSKVTNENMTDQQIKSELSSLVTTFKQKFNILNGTEKAKALGTFLTESIDKVESIINARAEKAENYFQSFFAEVLKRSEEEQTTITQDLLNKIKFYQGKGLKPLEEKALLNALIFHFERLTENNENTNPIIGKKVAEAILDYMNANHFVGNTLNNSNFAKFITKELGPSLEREKKEVFSKLLDEAKICYNNSLKPPISRANSQPNMGSTSHPNLRRSVSEAKLYLMWKSPSRKEQIENFGKLIAPQLVKPTRRGMK